jgi:hypothetical protein
MKTANPRFPALNRPPAVGLRAALLLAALLLAAPAFAADAFLLEIRSAAYDAERATLVGGLAGAPDRRLYDDGPIGLGREIDDRRNPHHGTRTAGRRRAVRRGESAGQWTSALSPIARASS